MRAAWALLPLTFFSGCLDSAERPDTDPAATTTTSGANPLGAWTELAALPTPRTELACAFAGPRLYAVGGFNSQSAPISTVEAFDPKAGAWTRVADYPVAVHHLGVVGHAGRLYGFGGHTGTQVFVATTAVFRYDPAGDLWTPEAQLPRARGAFAIGLVGDEVYLAGGTDSQRPGATIHAITDIYNLTTKQWRTGPSLSQPREHLAGAGSSGTFVVAGGRMLTLSSNVATTETLTAGSSAWTGQKPMPTSRGGNAAAAWQDQVVVFGGESSSGTFDEAEGFNVTTGAWTTYPAMPTARHGLCAAPSEAGIHVVGGGPQPGYSVSGRHELLDPRAG